MFLGELFYLEEGKDNVVVTGRNLAGRQDHATRGGQEYHNTDGVG